MGWGGGVEDGSDGRCGGGEWRDGGVSIKRIGGPCVREPRSNLVKERGPSAG